MIPLLRKLKAGLMDLLWNEAKVRTWARAFLLWASTFGAQVMAYPQEVVVTWGVRDWAIRAGLSALAGVAGLVAVGQRNPNDEQIAAAVKRVGEAGPVAP